VASRNYPKEADFRKLADRIRLGTKTVVSRSPRKKFKPHTPLTLPPRVVSSIARTGTDRGLGLPPPESKHSTKPAELLRFRPINGSTTIPS
jgi:hypothetical protein